MPRRSRLVRLSDRLLRPARGRRERTASRDVLLHDRARRRGSRGRPEGPGTREDPPAREQLWRDDRARVCDQVPTEPPGLGRRERDLQCARTERGTTAARANIASDGLAEDRSTTTYSTH